MCSGRDKILPPHLTAGDNQRPERAGTGVREPSPESSAPGENLGRGEGGGINSVGDMGVRRCLARSLTSLAFRYELQRVQTVPGGIHSAYFPLTTPFKPGTEDSASPFLHTGHGPFRTRPPNLR